MYLADTNIFLEALLEQDKKDDVQSFLQTIDLSTLYILVSIQTLIELKGNERNPLRYYNGSI